MTLLLLAGGVGLMAGCAGRRVLLLSDAVVVPDEPARLQVSLERHFTLALRTKLAGRKVVFAVDDVEVGSAETDRRGRAELVLPLPPSRDDHYEASVLLDGRRVTGSRSIYRWSPDRTIVTVDIDDTVSATRYRTLFISWHDERSEPLEHSREVLHTLAGDYHLHYFSARPRWLKDKTRQ